MTGCLFQIYKICDNYFSYETNTYVRYEDEDKISLPAVTVCIRKNLLIREELLHHFSPKELENRYSPLEESEIDAYLNNLTVKEQFSSIYSAEEVFNNTCKVMKSMVFKSSEFTIDCELISPVRQTIDYYFSCFTFFSQLNREENDKYIIDYDVNIKNYWSEYVGFRVNLNVSKFKLYLHSRYEMITDSYDDNFVELKFNPYYEWNIKYHLTKVQLLYKPYKTSCVDYNQFGYRSRSECIFKCRINYFRDRYKGWPGNYLTEQSSDEYMYKEIEILKKNESLDLALGKKCRNSCGLNMGCYKEYFTFKANEEINEYGMNSTILIYPPHLPSLIFTHLPKMQVEEFICFIASIVSLWFGFLVMMLSNVCSLVSKMFIKIVNKYKTNICVNNNYWIKRLEMIENTDIRLSQVLKRKQNNW
jgi:hypothetical protein